MESGWNVWVWLVGVVSRRWVWLVGVGGIYGCGYWCGCKEVYRFLILLIPTPLVSVLFAAASLLFVHFVKCFFIYYSGVGRYFHLWGSKNFNIN